MSKAKKITNTIGQIMEIGVLDGKDVISMRRVDIQQDVEILLDRRSAEILSAYLEAASVFGFSERPSEHLGDDHMTILDIVEIPAPLVRVRQKGHEAMDIHAPFWEILRIEISMMIPRMNGVSPNVTSHHGDTLH